MVDSSIEMKKMIDQINKVLLLISIELNNNDSLWNSSTLNDIVVPEMKELLIHFEKGEKYFKYGKKQRMLESTYHITDTLPPLNLTELGKEIINLQRMYNLL